MLKGTSLFPHGETTGLNSQPAKQPVNLKVGIALRTFDFFYVIWGFANADPNSLTNRLRSTVFETMNS
ncbi:MAG: hypothetical protein CM15mP23_00010 [Cryomorphaceae bacterium]|nr:MAG: hypothetical protein CM15mP23_00010 [Cryomorphaceae bacterium]